MKKKIMAGIVSLLMVATTMPMGELAQVVPSFGISASAASTLKTKRTTWGSTKAPILSGIYTIAFDKVETSSGSNQYKNKSITITAYDDYFSDTIYTKMMEVDMSSVRDYILSQGESISDCDIILKTSFSKTTKESISHITFCDDFITTVGDSAFSGCINLQTVKFSDKITAIGSSSFSGCTYFAGENDNILNLNNVTTIGNNAFNGCKTITGINFNQQTKSIGNNAFSQCVKLGNITIPESVEAIGNNAFSGDSSIEKVVFEGTSKLKTIGDSVFSNCTLLRKVVGDGNDSYGNNESCLPESIVNLISDAANLDADKKKIYDGTGKNLFSGCSSLQSFRVTTNFRVIPGGMFSNCTKLESVSFDESSNCWGIGEKAFYSCTSLVKFKTPQCTVAFDPYAFANCTQLSELIVSDSLSYAGKSCFSKCTKLSLAPISKENQLVSNTILIPDSLYLISEHCFEYCTGVTNVDFNNVQAIDKYAFQYCTSLRSADVPDAVTLFSEGVFKNCTSLKKVDYSKNLVKIDKYAFQNCTAFEQATPHGKSAYADAIQFPSSFTFIGKQAFENCSAFKYLNILMDNGESEFATMEEKAFSGCTSLVGSTTNGTTSQSLEFPKGVVVIQDSVFNKCTNLIEVQFRGNVTSIGDSAFYECNALKSVTMNPTIQSLGLRAFYKCTSLKDLPKTVDGKSALTQLEVVRDNAFNGCTSLTDISIPKNISVLGKYSFANCTDLNRVQLASDSVLSEIGEGVFSNCTKLSVISTSSTGTVSTFPNKLASIGKSAFAKTALTSVVVPKLNVKNAYTNIGDSAFSSCESLRTCDLSETNMSSVKNSTFSGCESLTTIKLPTTLTEIASSAFNNCKKLSYMNSDKKNVYNIPQNVKSIGGNAFNNNYCMATINIPAATDIIDQSAWNLNLTYTEEDLKKGTYAPLKEINVDSGNVNFKSVDGVLFSKDGTILYNYPIMKQGTSYTVPSSVTELSQSCFSSNNYLKKVVLNSNLEKIDKEAFNKCESLKAIVFGSNLTVSIDKNAFKGYSSNNPICFYAKSRSTAKTYAESNSSVKFIDNFLEAKKISIDQGKSLNVDYKQGSTQLSLTMLTASNTNATDVVSWSSSNIDVANVDNEGRVTFKKRGKVVITATTASGLSTSITLTIKDLIDISKPKYVTKVSAKTYTGKAYKPTVKIIVGSKTLKNGVDYTVKYGTNKIGKGTIKIIGKGNYAGMFVRTFAINPRKTSVTVKAGSKGKFVAKVAKRTEATKYQISYSTNSKFKGAKTVSVKSLSSTLSGKSGKVYYVRVRTVRTSNGKNYVSGWSSAKKVRIK